MNIQDEVNNILAQKLFENFDTKKLINWAVDSMQSGYESDSLIILAGLDHESSEIREKYFWKALEELNLIIEKNESKLLSNYSTHVANSVLSDKLCPNIGLNKMLNICMISDYNYKYILFYELSEDLDYLSYGNYNPIYNHNITIENSNDFIKQGFKTFLECEKLQIGKEIREKAYCNQCKEISKPILQTKYQFKIPIKYSELTCSICQSNKINSFNSQIGREKIINKIKLGYKSK